MGAQLGQINSTTPVVETSEVGAANGVASLDASSNVVQKSLRAIAACLKVAGFTNMTFAVVNTFYKINIGTTVLGAAVYRFTQTSNYELNYTGTGTTRIQISLTVGIVGTVAGKIYEVSIAKNGVPLTNSSFLVVPPTGQVTNVTVLSTTSITTSDKITPIVRNLSDTTALGILTTQMTVKE